MAMNDTAALAAQQVIDEVWREIQRSPYVQREIGRPLERFPEIGEDEARRKAALLQPSKASGPDWFPAAPVSAAQASASAISARVLATP